jgi:putative ATP-dependent endonuclease of OLD family
MIETLREVGFGAERSARIEALEADPQGADPGELLGLIDAVGKGRFAQRLAPRIVGQDPPDYLGRAIEFVMNCV